MNNCELEKTPWVWTSELNITLQGDGFYISYNPSCRYFGSDTTALVCNDQSRFIVIDGDWRKEFSSHIKDGYGKCLELCRTLEDKLNIFSDPIEGKTAGDILNESFKNSDA